jgi:hypothetical protein
MRSTRIKVSVDSFGNDLGRRVVVDLISSGHDSTEEKQASFDTS